jgi:hypothetical protein
VVTTGAAVAPDLRRSLDAALCLLEGAIVKKTRRLNLCGVLSRDWLR